MSGRTVRIPADIEREDRILAGLTARQVIKLSAIALVLYGGWALTRPWMPTVVYLALTLPVGVLITVVVLGRRDGVALDSLLAAAVRQRLQPRRRIATSGTPARVPDWLPTPPGERAAELDLPALGVSEAGVVDLGNDGIAAIGAASTVNFALRTPAEQDALVAAFGRWLHSLSEPVQLLVRTVHLELSDQIAQLRSLAPGLPHAALERAARDHASHLEQLAARTDLLHRQVFIVMRESAGTSPGRLLQRLAQTVELLAPAGITVTPLDAGQTTAVLAAACNPDTLITPSQGLAAADEVITTTAGRGDGS